MAISVHTNKSALTALQTLNKTTSRLEESQNRINTGYKVATAKDNAAIYAVAQNQRSDTAALSAVKMSMDRATSIADVALAAGESISDLMNQLKEKVVAAIDPSADADARKAYDNDFKAILKQITSIINNAEFDGANILKGPPSVTTTQFRPLSFLANADATAHITLTPRNMSLGGTPGGLITIAATASISSATLAAGVLTQLKTSINNVNAALGQIGAEAKAIAAHNVFVSKLSDVLETGIGNLVDADLAKESARLQALQVQQQLGTQALSIANQAPQVVLSLFRGQ